MERWQVGTETQRWESYLDLDHYDGTVGDFVLANRIGATSYDELGVLENQNVIARMAVMPDTIPSSLDLAGLQEIHRYLFQDVYDWAGELRTVTISKGDGSFDPPGQIAGTMRQVSDYLKTRDLSRDVPEAEVPRLLARTYNAVNAIHPFREGNGRAQREFISALARINGYTVDWSLLDQDRNIDVCERGRHGDLAPLESVFATMVTRDQDLVATGSSSPRPPAVSEVVAQTRRNLAAAEAYLARPAASRGYVAPDLPPVRVASIGYGLGLG